MAGSRSLISFRVRDRPAAFQEEDSHWDLKTYLYLAFTKPIQVKENYPIIKVFIFL